ncbi:MAG: response regulator transcription factor [Candidatus Brocadiia bacterium]
MTIRVLVADDHRIVREGLGALIEELPNMEVVGEARDGRTAMRLVEELVPDIVLMDVAMPDLNGIEATRKIASEHPLVKVIALSMHSESQFVARMLEAGASGYMLKEGAFEELAAAIEEVSAGHTYLCPMIAGPLVEDYLRRLDGSQDMDDPLSPREREVLQLLAEGLTTRQIARRLDISPKTVETHRARIMDKLDIRSIAELTKYAIRQGLTPLED